MEFMLTGFKHFGNMRQYCFDAVREDRSREQITVAADLSLIRRYGIPLQELPLLCRLLLERHAKVEATAFTESDMVRYVSERAARANALVEKHRAHRGPVSDRVGHAWRGASPPQGER